MGAVDDLFGSGALDPEPAGRGAAAPGRVGCAGAADWTGREGVDAVPGAAEGETGDGTGPDGDDTAPVRLDTATGTTGVDPDGAAEAR
ncbi:hypothetical protein ABZ464_44190 [Streptomyces sp. NPDC005820]|uniref:hypothetical protein n=1 Tax=Streptomyces sp. NPDC005820 TaxID=3157069 RepID=UPI0033EC7218